MEHMEVACRMQANISLKIKKSETTQKSIWMHAEARKNSPAEIMTRINMQAHDGRKYGNMKACLLTMNNGITVH